MRRAAWRHTVIWLFACLACPLPVEAIQDPGASARGLEQGPYPVGYRNLYRLDSSRMWEPFPAVEGVAEPSSKPRPVRISVWYPALPTEAAPMLYEEYVTPAAPDDYFGRLNRVMSDYDLWSYHGMFDEDSAVVARLLSSGTGAVHEAPPAVGEFPIILYSAGWYSRSPDNTVMAEYLASHGYVVATVPQLGPGVVDYDFAVTPERIETQVEDLRFALEQLLEAPYTDAERIVASGFSIGGIVALQLQQRDERVDTVVGLDASFMFEDWADVTLDLQGIGSSPNQPTLLVFHRGHERQADGLTRRVLDALPEADRYVVTVARATHGEFSNEPSLFSALGVPWLRADFNTLDEALSAHHAVIGYMRVFLDDLFESGDSGLIRHPSSAGSPFADLLHMDHLPPVGGP